jgi:hypothetical protein
MPTDPPQLNPAALSLADLARVLTLAGGQRIDVAMLEADLAAGAPTNADGTVNVVHYTAWLVKEMSRRGRD